MLRARPHRSGVVWWGAVRCSAVWWCGAVLCGAVRCGGVVRFCAVLCGVVWCGAVWCGESAAAPLWCGVVGCGAVLCGALRCGVVVWCSEVRCGGVVRCAQISPSLPSSERPRGVAATHRTLFAVPWVQIPAMDIPYPEHLPPLSVAPPPSLTHYTSYTSPHLHFSGTISPSLPSSKSVWCGVVVW